MAVLTPADLLHVLDEAYTTEELRGLCFALDVAYDDLPGEGQAAKARELVAYLQRRGRLGELEAALRADRPGVLSLHRPAPAPVWSPDLWLAMSHLTTALSALVVALSLFLPPTEAALPRSETNES